MSVPASQILIIADLAIDNRYEHSLYFDSLEDQRAYFESKVVRVFNGYTYLRRNWSIKVEADMSEARKWTYLTFTNPKDRKDYYYFITKVEYKNDSTVELFVEMDVIQTYMFDWFMGQCFVERTHAKSDQIGEHTIDEGLEIGELINAKTVDYPLNDLCIMVLTAVDRDGHSVVSAVYDDVYSGLKVYAVEMSKYQQLGAWLDDLSTMGKIDGIVNLWMYPKSLVRISGAWGDDTLLHAVVGGTKSETINVYEATKPILIDGYAPSNNKLFCYPYTMLYVTNNAGGSAVYQLERFTDSENKAVFEIFGAISPESGVKIAPHNYKGMDLNYDEGLALGSFPSCTWDSDTYKVWLAQNQNMQNLTVDQAIVKAGFGLISAIGSAATLNASGALAGVQTEIDALHQIEGVMAQRKDMAVQPPQARGSFSANLNLANKKHGFSFHVKTITAEIAKSIDEYFTRYGYKVNRLMQPILKARRYHTYIKTIGCTIDGEIGSEDRVKIQSIFDHGITFWTDPASIGIYSPNNDPV